MQLNPRANEAILLHGTEEKNNVIHIAQQGFDERFNKGHFYGRGIYLTSEACKAVHHGHESCVVVARVLLGYPYMAKGPMRDAPRPPDVELDKPGDSTIVTPGIPRDDRKSQVHWEFLVRDDQVFPGTLPHAAPRAAPRAPTHDAFLSRKGCD